MNDWLIGLIVGLIVVAAETVVGTVIGLIIKRWWNKRQADKAELDRLREQERLNADNARCDLMKATIHNEMIDMKIELKTDIKPLQEDLDLMKKTMQKDTRRSLRQDAAKYIQRGWASGQEKTEYDELYWCYHNLGRNGVVDSDHEKVMALPEAPEGDN